MGDVNYQNTRKILVCVTVSDQFMHILKNCEKNWFIFEKNKSGNNVLWLGSNKKIYLRENKKSTSSCRADEYNLCNMQCFRTDFKETVD